MYIYLAMGLYLQAINHATFTSMGIVLSQQWRFKTNTEKQQTIGASLSVCEQWKLLIRPVSYNEKTAIKVKEDNNCIWPKCQ